MVSVDNTQYRPERSVFDNCAIFSTGETVYKQDAFSDTAYYVQKGYLKIYRVGAKGQQQIIRVAKEGDIIGYHSQLTQEPEYAACECMVNSVLCQMSGSSLSDYLKTKNDLAASLLRLTCDEIKSTCDSIVEISQNSVRSRMANLIVKLMDVFKLSEGESFPFKISRDDMASWVGTSKESVSRALNDFNRERLISLSTKGFVVENLQGIKKVIIVS
ncbi:Crp/Fnr family transcriptional regulator [Carboxylicivirga sp. N1Y90]|uniref:Crp/Fnr family transcriptional regulator n=1 Tax=Carboxylicivirga fragile TaxID=3417571 RepID=UPI003D32EC3C|nr:Crp/Fnr family transcriptional regulator [Marinilabiliaceae bacterium N1Y90]